MNTNWKLLLTVFSLAVCVASLAGCKKEVEEPEPEETTGAEAPLPEPEPEPVAIAEVPCTLQTVYFAFDSSELDAAARAAIEEAVECFRGRGADGSLLLTGACDPRGTEEYNLALGERRADAVRTYMRSLGADTSRISITSVGEEFATGTDETSWARDRNVTANEN